MTADNDILQQENEDLNIIFETAEFEVLCVAEIS
jgi:hypothetical protein